MEDPALHRRFTDALFAAWNMLFRYKRYFSEYNDPSGLHSIGVIEYCNLLAGEDQIRSLNADEIYVLLMACCLYDAGMGISPEEFDEFSRSLDLESISGRRGASPGTGSSGTSIRNSAPFSSTDMRLFWSCPHRSISLR